MNEYLSILSTKKLKKEQLHQLFQQKVRYSEYSAIKITFIDFECSSFVKNGIFTSVNSVNSVLKKRIQVETAFCVGEKTKKRLETQAIQVAVTERNARNLAERLVEKYRGEQFTFFCGKERRDELPAILLANKVKFDEVVTYTTSKIIKEFDTRFDVVLFFSPSGVKSFVRKNNLQNTLVFCIGNTTASEAKKHTDMVVVANTPTVEGVLDQVLYFISNGVDK